MKKIERAVIAVILVALLGTAWACRYETLRLNSRGWVLRINRWTGQKYMEYPQWDSVDEVWLWTVSPGEVSAHAAAAEADAEVAAAEAPPTAAVKAAADFDAEVTAKAARTDAQLDAILAEAASASPPAPAPASSSGH